MSGSEEQPDEINRITYRDKEYNEKYYQKKMCKN